MKIAILGTIWINTPPPQYGGTEDVVYHLANGLSEKGHDVTLFAPHTVQTKAKLSPTVTVPLREKNISWNDISYNLYHISQFFDHANEFDVLHIHLNKNQDYMILPLAARSKIPVVITIHFALPTLQWRPERYQLLLKYKNLPFTSISSSQQKGMPLNFIETIYNALDISQFPFSPSAKDYVCWLGKIVPHKGTKEAILAARKATIPIKVAGVVDSGMPESVEYFEKEVKPLVDGKDVEYIGPVGMPYKAELLGKAKALLNPIQWEEPFGLVMAEAQAVGTPVIAFKRGAAPEVIEDNKTGFLVDSVDEMAQKIANINKLSRKDCRAFIETKFSLENMIEGYELAYQASIEHWDTYIRNVEKTAQEYKNRPAQVE